MTEDCRHPALSITQRTLKLQRAEPPIKAVGILRELIMRPAFHHATLIKDNYLIRAPNSSETMRDDKGRAAGHQAFECVLHESFAFAVERTCGFVENQDRRIFQNGSRNRDALTLPA